MAMIGNPSRMESQSMPLMSYYDCKANPPTERKGK